MIPHHQVAIDMCKLMKPFTKNHFLQSIYRDMIYNQTSEINYMENLLRHLPNMSAVNSEVMFRDSELKTLLSLNKYSKPKNYVCDPLFFDPHNHAEHMKHMKQSDRSFLEHMISHHQVAIDMSKRLLQYTINPSLTKLCYDIIISQRSEIFTMNHLLDYLITYDLDFLPITL